MFVPQSAVGDEGALEPGGLLAGVQCEEAEHPVHLDLPPRQPGLDIRQSLPPPAGRVTQRKLAAAQCRQRELLRRVLQLVERFPDNKYQIFFVIKLENESSEVLKKQRKSSQSWPCLAFKHKTTTNHHQPRTRNLF